MRPPVYASNPATKSEIRPLTSIRGIAAMAVVIYHFAGNFADKFYLDNATLLFSRGYLWVDFFFLLSGFILSHVHAEEFARGSAPYHAFLLKRIARVYPLHVVTLFILLLPLFWPRAQVLQTTRTPASFVSNLLMVQAWGASDHLSWNYPSWSISDEWAAYLLFPVIVAVFYRGSLILAATVAALAIFGLDWLTTFAGPPDRAHDFGVNVGWLRCLVEFSTGVVVYRIFKMRPYAMRSDLAFGVLATAVLIAMHFGIPDMIIVFLFCGLLCATALNTGKAKRVLSLRPIYYLGLISYSIYMTQALVQLGFMDKEPFRNFVASLPPWSAFVVFVLCCASVIGVAAVSYRFVELPGRSMVKWSSRRLLVPSGPA
jgi:peptidoglycan/LPS O-acetylase OafA/YrhL